MMWGTSLQSSATRLQDVCIVRQHCLTHVSLTVWKSRESCFVAWHSQAAGNRAHNRLGSAVYPLPEMPPHYYTPRAVPEPASVDAAAAEPPLAKRAKQ
ncbi:hypothetical protein HaLaN_26748 [Haematococcus lacustris]|uniref:Uncharacterized protein n=1 Tax=Haematococcus lacustris TaxID=44745 RepID=A0A6A0A700_HAELA|nr:hypothetical protein HaLaN_26748 [Haematococcus lacustris]